MQAWLVMGRCSPRDVPLGSFSTPEGAELFAAGVTPYDVIREARQLLMVELSAVLGVDVIGFDRGVPTSGSLRTIRNWEAVRA